MDNKETPTSTRNDEQNEDGDKSISRSNSSSNNNNNHDTSSPPPSTSGSSSTSSSSGSESESESDAESESECESKSGSDASTTHESKLRRLPPAVPPLLKLYATIDVLTDGSEYTGTGCGTLFLSIWKSKRPYDDHDHDHNNSNTPEKGEEEEEEEREENGLQHQRHQNQALPLARYGLSGLGDGFGRLCADQRFKISPIRAVFLPSFQKSNNNNNTSNNNNNQVDGIPSLLLALISAGSPSLHVVIPPDWNPPRNNDRNQNQNQNQNQNDSFEELSTLVLGRHRQFDIRTCHVPKTDTSSSIAPATAAAAAATTTWWKVYDDEYLEVHCGTVVASSLSSAGLSSTRTTTDRVSFLVYLVSFSNFLKRRRDKMTRTNVFSTSSSSFQQYSTLLVLPPSCHQDEIEQILQTIQQQELPILPDGFQMTIDHTIALGLPFVAGSSATDTRNKQDLHAVSNKKPPKPPKRDTKKMNVFATMCFPSDKNSDGVDKAKKVGADPGILIRSQQLARYFNLHMPWAFPFQPPELSLPSSSSSSSSSSTTTKENNAFSIFQDPSSFLSIHKLQSGTSVLLTRHYLGPREPDFNIIDRRRELSNKDLRDEWTSSLESLQSFVPLRRHQKSHQNPTPQTLVEDENEIDIDSDSEESTGGPENGRTAEQSTAELEDEGTKIQQKPFHEERSHSFDEKRPQLICLGTNCATPSAYRGSSSYALVFPTPSLRGPSSNYLDPLDDHTSSPSVELYILDCGEGTATMLSRCCGSKIDDWNRRIKGIWISHAHLDHYGGLPTLLRLLHSEREAAIAQVKSEQKQHQQQYQQKDRYALHHSTTKRQRYSYDISTAPTIPWVMAPAKVLHYIDILLQCRHGRCLANNSVQYFHPRFHHDPTIPPGPWIHFENIKVQHNCCPSFGLLLGLRDDFSDQSNEEKNVDDRCNFLCYSGDTRPCFGLVQACRKAMDRRVSTIGQRNWEKQPQNNNKLFLIHEATFDDEERSEAEKKMHSTLSDAVQVANDIPASKVLLTHFSQRYISLTINNNKKKQQHTNDRHLEGTAAASSSSSDAAAASNRSSNDNIPIGLAVDGLWVPI